MGTEEEQGGVVGIAGEQKVAGIRQGGEGEGELGIEGEDRVVRRGGERMGELGIREGEEERATHALAVCACCRALAMDSNVRKCDARTSEDK